jgi:hypothetical protein
LNAFWKTASEADEAVVFAIREAEGGKVVGTCGLYLISWQARRAQFNILIGEPDAWDRGYGREAAHLTLRYAFDTLNLNSVNLGVNADNARAMRSYERTGRDVVEWAKTVEGLGAGEIMITSIDLEGTMEGYDTSLIRAVQDAVSIPVIPNGGAGLLVDLLDLIKETDVSAVACSSLFLFTDNKPIKVKSFLQTAGVRVRPI